MTIPNPILPGFHPDPSIVRVGKDYFIATSTFEWFPGVRIYHSQDLANWKLIAEPLNRKSQLDMRGVPDSCGVWAPCLSYDNGVFYLVYSNVKTFHGPWLDTPNYLVTSENITGEWSEPIFLNASGFDGSLFHDDDGRKWYTSMLVDNRNSKFFGGIILQEYDPKESRLVGDSNLIFEGTSIGKTEGPHIYKKDGYYYLITAEGGTEYGHAISLARSKKITGPYEVAPNNPLLTSWNDPKHPLQKTGHGDLVETEEGKWYLTYLTGRPLKERGRCILGRETAIERVEWKDGWLYPCSNLKKAEVRTEPSKKSTFYDFKTEVSRDFQTLREPRDASWITSNKKEGLQLIGRNSLSSLFDQSLLARRIQSYKAEVSLKMTFSPSNFQQMAGLLFYYNTQHYHYFHLRGSEHGFHELVLITNNKHQVTEEIVGQTTSKSVILKGILDRDTITFSYQQDELLKDGATVDASILSDDYVLDGHIYHPAFTGMMVGFACQDLTGTRRPALFEWFDYKEF